MKQLTYQEFKQTVTINTHGKAFSATFKDSGREFSANGESENWAILNLMEYLSDEWGYTILKDQNEQPATPEQNGVDQGEEITNSGYVYRVNEIEKCHDQHLGNLTSLYVNDLLTSDEYKNLAERNKNQRKIKFSDLLERFNQLTKNHTQQ